MGRVIIKEDTIKNPITMIGKYAGTCWGANTTDDNKNYNRGLDCLKSKHGRTWEFPDIYMEIDGYSARVMREWYTHIGGAPTRLQASTRYINYKDFKYVVPNSVSKVEEAKDIFVDVMNYISNGMDKLEKLGIPREDIAMMLPFTMSTKVVCKHNFRNIADMSHQRMCTRAYWEYRELFNDLRKALSDYSEEWKYLVDNYLVPKCEVYGFCEEKDTCKRKPKKENA